MEASAARVDRAPFLDELEDNFTAAARAAGGVEDVDLRIAGAAVRLRFAGPALRRLLAPALEHLRAEPANTPDLIVRAWDSETTQTKMVPPPPDWDLEYAGRRGVVPNLPDGLDAAFVRWASTLSVVDSRRGEAWYWTPAASEVPSLEPAAPLRVVLRLWMARRGVPLVHGGAVGDERGCVLIVGDSGAGKSSASLAALDAGLGYLADDCCLVVPGARPRAHNVYRTAKVDPIGLHRMPGLAALVDGPLHADGKAVVLVPPDRLLREADVRAIAIPRIVPGEQTRVRPASAREGMAALGPSTLLNFVGADQEMLRRLAQIARAVPFHHLEAGARPQDTAAALHSLLDAP